jgi:CRP-like cAMP-binding protein
MDPPMATHDPIDRRALLARNSIFSHLESAELDALTAICKPKGLRAREVLFRKGDDGAQAYAIMSGHLKATIAGEDGKEAVLRIMRPGEIVGEVALFDGHPRSATVIAIEPAELLVIHRRDFLPFLERHPKVATKLLRELSERLRAVSTLLEDTLFLNLPSRLAKKLLQLGATHGREADEGMRIELKLSQQELGELVGTSRESINKQLRQWAEQDVLEMSRGVITIRDIPTLERLAGLGVL